MWAEVAAAAEGAAEVREAASECEKKESEEGPVECEGDKVGTEREGSEGIGLVRRASDAEAVVQGVVRGLVRREVVGQRVFEAGGRPPEDDRGALGAARRGLGM
jgi:hypothetical protein